MSANETNVFKTLKISSISVFFLTTFSLVEKGGIRNQWGHEMNSEWIALAFQGLPGRVPVGPLSAFCERPRVLTPH